MKNKFRILTLLLICVLLAKSMFAEEDVRMKGKRYVDIKPSKSADLCRPATGSMDLDINNVRARINTGGDMWWDFTESKYEIPKGSRKTAMFSAALWIGGKDVTGNIKLAAQRYRSNGVDYWTGPLSVDGTAAITASTCDAWDKHYKITKAEVLEFMANFSDPQPGYTLPQIIEQWPAESKVTGATNYLAPFFDFDGDLKYDPAQGDYPYYDFNNSLCPTNPDRKNPDGTYKPMEKTMETLHGNGNPAVKGGILVDQVLKGDQTLWWVFNDKGNTHTESKGDPIGLEIRAQAFAFATNDEINNMTFYTYEIINRSTYTLTETYFSQWCDTDIGYAFDDYVGCDVPRGLGYTYNGKSQDGSGQFYAYEGNPPAAGVDFFQGPYMDVDNEDNPKVDGAGNQICDESINGVNFGNGIVDDERFGMRRFVYHVNAQSGPTSDPDNYLEYYRMLRGIWKDNTRMVYGGTGYPTSPGAQPSVIADFMFPALTDEWNWGTGCGASPSNKNWTEETPGSGNANPPGDRRFMHSAGPFTLTPGAVNYITVGIPFAQAASGGPMASVELLRHVDDKCQALFDNCFKVLDGPDAPDLVIQELDREIILYVTNRKTSNNFKESYSELDVRIPKLKQNLVTDSSVWYINPNDPNDKIYPNQKVKDSTIYDRYYKFEGYKIYQLRDKNISVADLKDAAKARLVAQCDIKNFDKNGNAVGQLINYYANSSLNGALVPTEEVNGGNLGVKHSFKILEDQFAEGDKRLVNHKKYYFMAVAYAYNGFKQFSVNDVSSQDGQKEPYLAGRKSATGEIKSVTAIPHIPAPMENGTVLNSAYGSSPQITRVEGFGNGGYVLEMTQKSIDEIMTRPNGKWFVEKPVYESGKGPVTIKVVDPLNVKSGNFRLAFNVSGTIDTARWSLVNLDDNSTILADNGLSDMTINMDNEQIIPSLGLSITVHQPEPLATELNATNKAGNKLSEGGVLESSLTFTDPNKLWLTGVPDVDANPQYNWIRSGTVKVGEDPTPEEASTEDYYYKDLNDYVFLDEKEQMEKIIDGTWTAYRMSSFYTNGPAYSVTSPTSIRINNMSNLASVNIVFTPDKSKWTRCPVIEMGEDHLLTSGNARKFELRRDSSVNKEGVKEVCTFEDNTKAITGMGWFPGYAINLETGERLNMMFGEDSWLIGNNGQDMRWNPSSLYSSTNGDIVWGGKHFVYVFGHNDNIKDGLTLQAKYQSPAYDEGKWAYNALNTFISQEKQFIFANIMWVGMPMVNSKFVFKDPANMPCEAKIKIRVKKPFARYSASGSVQPTSVVNNNYPAYEFSTTGLVSKTNQNTVAKDALDLIGVVPNPYYAFSKYETSQLDNRVRIINLPQRCTVTIYTVNGVLIRQFKVDKKGLLPGKGEALTSIDWDLKNFANIPISGGVYLIHIQADGIGEKVVKWFGALRPTDLNSF